MTRNDYIEVHVDHDGVDTTEYELFVNGVSRERKPLTAAAVMFELGKMPPGIYVARVDTHGPEGSTPGIESTLTVTAGKPKPASIRFVVRTEINA